MSRPDRTTAWRLANGTGGRPGNGNGTRAGNGNGRLTPRQEEILLHCVERGYYEIPRRRTLRVLASELGISAPSLSLLLRRAESKLVKAFAQQHSVEAPALQGAARPTSRR